jgi:hypothetical protein
MIKKIGLAAIALIGVFSLAGCNQPTVAQIQAATIAACNFEPTAIEVAGLIPNINPLTVTTADEIAKTICAAIKAATSTPAGARKPKASGPITVDVVTPNGKVIKVTGVIVK